VKKRTLNDRIITALKPAPNGKRYMLMDTIVPNFGVEITRTAHKSYKLVTRYPGRIRPERGHLAVYGEITLQVARDRARNWIEQITRGLDPREEAERQRKAELAKRGNTFAMVAEDFIKEKVAHERKGAEVERDIRREFMPLWDTLPITRVSKNHVVNMVKSTKDRGKLYQAHNLFSTARRLFQWAVDQHVYGLEVSPCAGLKADKLIGEKKARQRILNNDELAALWKSASDMGSPYGPLYHLLCLTGLRRDDVGEAQWSEFDLREKIWTIPAARMKMDAAHAVPLTDDMLAILRGIERGAKGDYVFSTEGGVRPVNSYAQAKIKLDRAMTIALGAEPPPFINHDIRRTVRTNLPALQVSDTVAEALMAHARPGIHGVYDLYSYLPEKRAALEKWGKRLADIVAAADNVVPLRA
jgi:integrase